MHAPGIARAAATVLALEGAALAVIALVEMFGLGSGDATVLSTGIALIVLTLIGAGALLAFAIGTLRGASWARSGGIVLQVIAVVIAIASLTQPPVIWWFVLALGVPGVLGFVLLVSSAKRETPVRPTHERSQTPDD